MDPKKKYCMQQVLKKLSCERNTVYKSHPWHYSHKNEMVLWYITFVQARGPAITELKEKLHQK